MIAKCWEREKSVLKGGNKSCLGLSGVSYRECSECKAGARRGGGARQQAGAVRTSPKSKTC